MKIIVMKLTGMIIVVMGMSLALHVMYLNKFEKQYSWPNNVFPKSAIKDKYEIVKLGNSHAGDGITFEKYNLRSLDLTGSAQELRYDLAKLRQYSNQIEKGAVILIAVTPISFSQSRTTRDDALQRFYYGQISPLLLPYVDYGDYLQDQFLPFFQTGYFWRKDIAKKIQDKIDKEQFNEKDRLVNNNDNPILQEPVKVKNTQGKSDPKNKLNMSRNDYYFNVEGIKAEIASPSSGNTKRIEESMHLIFRKWIEDENFSPDHFEENRKDLERLITYCQKKNWKPILVIIPISKVLEEGLIDDYKQIYIYDNLEKTDLNGVEYFDFSVDQTPKGNADFYSNADHLNQDGAALFSYLLLQKLIDEGYLPKSADGYDYGPLYVDVE